MSAYYIHWIPSQVDIARGAVTLHECMPWEWHALACSFAMPLQYTCSIASVTREKRDHDDASHSHADVIKKCLCILIKRVVCWWNYALRKVTSVLESKREVCLIYLLAWMFEGARTINNWCIAGVCHFSRQNVNSIFACLDSCRRWWTFLFN